MGKTKKRKDRVRKKKEDRVIVDNKAEMAN